MQRWILFSLLLTPSLWAESAPPPPPDHPCKAVEAACEAGGFLRHGHRNGKGFWMDCLRPLLANQQVEGVKADAKDVASCRAHRARGPQVGGTNRRGAGPSGQGGTGMPSDR